MIHTANDYKKLRRQLLAAAILTLATSAPIVAGIFGIGQPGRNGAPGQDTYERGDMGYYHSAGRCWLAGKNPYIYKNFEAYNVGAAVRLEFFSYAPTISLLAMGYGLLPRATANNLCAALNFAALIGLAFMTYRLAARQRDDGRPEGLTSGAWIPAAVVLAGPSSSVVIWVGNVALIVALLIVVGWELRHRGHPVLAGAIIAMATIKPQLAMLPFLWMALTPRGSWKFLASFTIAALVLSSGALLTIGLIPTATTWIDSVKTFRHQNFVTTGPLQMLPFTTGLESLMVTAGVKDPPFMAPVAVGLAALIFVKRRRFLPDDILPILLLISLGVIMAHSYDFVLMAPAYAALWRHVRGRPGPMLVALGLVALLNVPRAFLRVVLPDVAIFWQWRTVIDLILLGWLVALNCFTHPRSEAETIGNT
jgi:Glycosyltransferase family 87